MPDGTLAEAVLDTGGSAFARLYSSGSWSQWWAIGSNAVDVSVAAANVSTVDTAYVSVTFRGGSPADRGIYALTSSGITGTAL
ncbi:MAG: hypothetical protein ACRDOU_05270 [Streptosporangiaceae bacterium]